MFLLWTGLACLYTANFIQLLAGGDPGGALVVGAIAAAFGVLGWRSFQKRKARRTKRCKTAGTAVSERLRID